MKTLIAEFISLDGVVQAPGGADEDEDGGFTHGGWSMKYFDPEVMGGMYTELAAKSDALLQGRRTYQVSAAAWPSRSGDPFADWINRVQKYVVSDTLTVKDAMWNYDYSWRRLLADGVRASLSAGGLHLCVWQCDNGPVVARRRSC